MRSLFILLIASILITFVACKSSNNDVGLTNEQQLTSHTWVSYRVIFPTNDTLNSTAFSFTFNPNGTFTATGYTFSDGSSSGTWSLNNSVLTLGNTDNWEVQLLTNSKLHIRKPPTEVQIHLN